MTTRQGNLLRQIGLSNQAGWMARGSLLIVIAILAGIGINHVYWAVVIWPLGDMHVYLDAAVRLRSGEALYVDGDIALSTFWYAPWFAAAWVPLSYLPRELVAIGWSAILLLATALVCVELARLGRAGVMFALMVGPMLFAVSAGGNVQSVMVLALLLGLTRPWGPLVVAAAASLKFTPILFVLVYVARREWWRVLLTLVATAVLLVPAVLLGLGQARPSSGAAPSLLGFAPLLYALTVVAAVAAALVVRPSFAPLASALAALLALPRLVLYDVTMLVPGAAPAREADASAPAQRYRSMASGTIQSETQASYGRSGRDSPK